LLCLLLHAIFRFNAEQELTVSMKAPDIHYECPTGIDEALSLLSGSSGDCQALAGGQSLLPMMHLRMANPDLLLDLNKVAELDFITSDDTNVQIGAMVRYAALLESKEIQNKVPLFTTALPYIAHEAIRNRGTIGGSIALADPAAEMPALLLALNANVVVISQRGKRVIPADEFFLGIYETAIAEDELVHSIEIPVAKSNQPYGFYELARRHGDYAMAGVAITATSVEPLSDLRIAFFSVSERAVRATQAETILNGANLSDKNALDNAQDSLSAIDYMEDANASADMKAHLARVVLQRALHGMVNVDATE